MVTRRKESRELRKYSRIESNNPSTASKILSSPGVICLTVTA
jgi:hypothetical protein